MKRLLLLGAMLIASASSYALTVKLEGVDKPAAPGPATHKVYNGSANLPLNSSGNIIDPTNKMLLVVKPTVSAGADGGSLEFDFGRMTKDATKSLVGKFTAEVFKGGDNSNNIGQADFYTPIKLTDANVVVNLNGKMDTNVKNIVNPLYSSTLDTTTGPAAGNRKEIGKIAYTIAPSSGVQGNYVYEGILNTEVTLGKKTGGGTAEFVTGTFTDNSVYIFVGVKDIPSA